MWPALSAGADVERNVFIVGAENNLAVFDWPYKLAYVNGEDTEGFVPSLFNVLEDPTEQNDLSAQMPEITERLLAEIEAMPEPEISRLEPAFNNSPRYYPEGVPTWDLRLEADLEPWAEAVTNGTLPIYHEDYP